MACDCQIVDGHLRVQAVGGYGTAAQAVIAGKPCQSVDDAMAWLDAGRIATVADSDIPEVRRRLDVRAMLSDPEYAAPGELDRVVEAWPEKCDRRVASLERRMAFLEATVHRLINAGSVQDAMG